MNYLRLILSTAFIFLAVQGMAQKTALSGIVKDTTGETLPGASVMILSASDSILVSFGITNKQGQFKIPGIATGDYILQVSYVGLGLYSKKLTLDGSKPDKNLGSIKLSPRNDLNEFEVVSEHVPIRINNDTVEYNANAFKTQPHDAVENLLKQLPGLEVDADGNVKAQGEEVTKILVDGKEFFGDDPKIATQNLPADAIDKVQVYEKKSEYTEFTGIDDGERVKTINLKLKDDRKSGYFGNIMAGYGTQERYAAKVNINHFDKKSQVSFLGMSNNINEQGFSFNQATPPLNA